MVCVACFRIHWLVLDVFILSVCRYKAHEGSSLCKGHTDTIDWLYGAEFFMKNCKFLEYKNSRLFMGPEGLLELAACPYPVHTFLSYFLNIHFNTLRTGDADLRF